MQTPNLRLLVALIFFILLVQIAALYGHLYFHFWWLDIVVHILGGVWIGLLALSVRGRFVATDEGDRVPLHIFALAIAASLTIGLCWEIYEFGVDRAVGDSSIGLADTLHDLVNDGIGGVIAALIFILRKDGAKK